MYRSNYDWDNYFAQEKPSYEDWLFNEQLAYDAERLRERQAMNDLIKQAYLRQYYKRHRYDAGGIMGGIASTADLVTDIAGDWQTVKNSGKQAEADIKKNVNNEDALQALTSGNLYDTSSVDAFMKSSSAAQSNLANVRDATMKDAGGKENAFLNGFVASNRDALKGATAGAQFGGPWGAAIGGITGGVAGAITGIFGSKKINKKRRKAVNKYNRMYNANSIQQMYANSQANAADAVNRKQQLAAKANLVANGGELYSGGGTFGNKNFGDMFINVNKDIATELPKLAKSFAGKGAGASSSSSGSAGNASLGKIASSFGEDANKMNANSRAAVSQIKNGAYVEKKPVELGNWKQDYSLSTTTNNSKVYQTAGSQGSGNKYHQENYLSPISTKTKTAFQSYYNNQQYNPYWDYRTNAYGGSLLADGGDLSEKLENPYQEYLDKYFADSPYINSAEAYDLDIDDLDIEATPSLRYYIDQAKAYQDYLEDYQKQLRERAVQQQEEQSDLQKQNELLSAYQLMRLKQQELNDYRNKLATNAMLGLEQAEAETRKKYESERQKQIDELYNRIFQ